MNRLVLRAASVACVSALASCATQTVATVEATGAVQIPAVAATRDSIAYVVAKGYGDARRFQLVVADPDGRNVEVIVASNEPLLSPAWSPDGRRLAYAGFDHGRSTIFITDIESRTPRILVQEEGVNGAPAFSPDGTSLAVSLSFGRNADIYVIDLATGKRRRVTDDPAIDTEPAWSPDSSEIAFTSDRTGLPQIYTVSSSGGEAHRVSIEGKKNMRPAYSPDGAELALVHYEGSRSRIGLLHLQGHVFRTVSAGPMDESPSFAPDGASLVYADVQAGDLAVIGMDRHRVRSIPQRGDVHEVAWSLPSASQRADLHNAIQPMLQPGLRNVAAKATHHKNKRQAHRAKSANASAHVDRPSGVPLG